MTSLLSFDHLPVPCQKARVTLWEGQSPLPPFRPHLPPHVGKITPFYTKYKGHNARPNLPFPRSRQSSFVIQSRLVTVRARRQALFTQHLTCPACGRSEVRLLQATLSFCFSPFCKK